MSTGNVIDDLVGPRYVPRPSSGDSSLLNSIAAEEKAPPSSGIESDESQSSTLLRSFLYYLYETTSGYLFALLTSPSSILFDPLSTFTALLVYPFLWILLAGIVLVLWVGEMVGGGELVEKVSKKWFKGYSIVNWVSSVIDTPETY